jgi:hypothetical protein
VAPQPLSRAAVAATFAQGAEEESIELAPDELLGPLSVDIAAAALRT